MDPAAFWGNPTGPLASPSAPADPQGQAPALPGTPGAAADPTASQAPMTSPQEQQPGESTVDYEARLREEAEARQRAEAEVQRLRGTMTQFEQGLQQFAAQQQAQQQAARYQQREDEIYTHAAQLAPQDALGYIRQQMGALRSEQQQEIQQLRQQAELEKRQIAERFGTPLFIEEIVKQHGLPPEAKDELLALGNPNVAAQYAPQLKARYEQISNLQNQINQLSRSQQANALQQAGLGAVGGTAPSGGQVLSPSGDPDVDAMRILAALRQGTYVASR